MRISLFPRPQAVAAWAAAAALACTPPARAQGIPVIDSANLAQTIQQVINDVTQIQNQIQQITQLQQQISSMTGVRGLGMILNDPRLLNYLPPMVYQQLDAVRSSGYAGLGATAKALRDAAMVYNCNDRPEAERAACQARLAEPYEVQGLIRDAMAAASGRVEQIQSLMQQINATDDPKSIQELQARISAENALLSHESSQIQMLQGLEASDQRVEAAKARERRYELTSRQGSILSRLPAPYRAN